MSKCHLCVGVAFSCATHCNVQHVDSAAWCRGVKYNSERCSPMPLQATAFPHVPVCYLHMLHGFSAMLMMKPLERPCWAIWADQKGRCCPEASNYCGKQPSAPSQDLGVPFLQQSCTRASGVHLHALMAALVPANPGTLRRPLISSGAPHGHLGSCGLPSLHMHHSCYPAVCATYSTVLGTGHAWLAPLRVQVAVETDATDSAPQRG